MSTIYPPAEDSYLLIDVLNKKVPKLLNEKRNLKFLEIGSGSGVILQKVFDLGVKRENIYSVDVNKSAVRKCKSLGFKCVHSNLFSKVKGKFDLIVFNPPYLPKDKREPFDSEISTTGGEKGSEIINEFIKKSKKHLTKNGIILILFSSHTRGIDFRKFKKRIVKKKSLFFEKLLVVELRN